MKRSDLKEEKKTKRFKLLMEATDKKFKLEEMRTMMERFKLLMEATDKKIKLEETRTMIEERKTTLEEKRVKITVNTEDAKMMTLNVDSLDAGARMIVQSVCYQLLQRQKDELTEADADTEVAYAAATTPP